MVRTDRSAAEDAGARELLAVTLDAAAASARRDERPRTRVARGSRLEVVRDGAQTATIRGDPQRALRDLLA